MLFYVVTNPPEIQLDIETVQELLVQRFNLYSLTGNLQCDTEEFNYCDGGIHLLMSIFAIEFPQFRETFINGEVRIFREKLKRAKSARIRNELLTLLEFLCDLKSEDCKELKVVQSILRLIVSKCTHAFRSGHPKSCRKHQLRVPFTFPLKLIGRREVEVHGGKVVMSCGRWDELLELIFEHSLKLELKLLGKCEDLKTRIWEEEDDRLRHILKKFSCYLRGGAGPGRRDLKSVEVDQDSCHFPPCMSQLHQILRKTHRLSYESRYLYTLFLKDIGLSVEENISFWENEYRKPAINSSCTHEWEEKHKRYKYQIQHLYGLIGSRGVRTSHPCEKFISGLDGKVDGCCPFQHLSSENLGKCLPRAVVGVPDVEDVFKYKKSGFPQRACAAYFRCQQKLLAGRKINGEESTGRVHFVGVMT